MEEDPLPNGPWRIQLLGALRARNGVQSIDRFPTQKTAALFAYLSFYRERLHSRETLITLLWPDADPAAARDRLSQALVWLRPHLESPGAPRGSVLQTDRLSVGLASKNVLTDVADFQAALRTARTASTPSARIAALESAVESYSGELLPEQYADWALTERRALAESWLGALTQLIAAQEAAGHLPRALDLSRRALSADPLREESHGSLIRLLAKVGQTAAALRQYDELHALFAREWGAEPSTALRAMVARIRAESFATPAVGGAYAETIAAQPRKFDPLPVPLTRLFGREADIERVSELLHTAGVRIVTLTGAGGAGKTRLALAVAHHHARTANVAFIPLADLDDHNRIPTAIVEALRLTDLLADSPVERIAEGLAESPLLLVLDNLEHLLPSAGAIVRTLLQRTPKLQILTTSRQRLGVEGEREAPVASLPQPDVADTPDRVRLSPSVQLFADRARAVRTDFAVNDDNAELIARLCGRLDGIPLAIELCAAWAQTLTPAQMLEKLDQRFDLLVSRRTDIPLRHRTLRAAVEYGYLQLPPHLQTLFGRLSLFRGGWNLAAAGAVCGETADANGFSILTDLTELRERSLIVAEESSLGEKDSEMRYRMLETLRDFAGEQITYAERTALRRTAAHFFLAFAEQTAAISDPALQKRALLRLDRERENLRATFDWSVESAEIEFGLRLSGALSWYWAMHGTLADDRQRLHDLLDRAERPATSPAVPGAILSHGWRTLGHLAWSQGDYAAARDAHSRALALRREYDSPVEIAESLYHLGITAYRQRDHDTARAFLEESLAIAKTRGDPAGVSRVLLNLGNIAYEQQRIGEARDLQQQSLVIERALANRQRIADVLNNLGLLSQAESDYPNAAALFEESLALHEALTNNSGAAFVMANLGTIRRLQNDLVNSGALLRSGLRLAFDLGNKFVMIHYLLQLGMVECAEDHSARGVFLISAAHQLSDTVGVNRALDSADGYAESLESARRQLTPNRFDRTWALGQTLPLTQVAALALDQDAQPPV